MNYRVPEPEIEGNDEQKAPALPAKKSIYSSQVSWFFVNIKQINLNIIILQHRHSNPEYYDHNASSIDVDSKTDGTLEKQKHATSTIELKNNSFSLASTSMDENTEINNVSLSNGGVLQAGAKRNIPKHQRPLTRWVILLQHRL